MSTLWLCISSRNLCSLSVVGTRSISVVYGAASRVAEVVESRRAVVVGNEAFIVRDHRRDTLGIIG